MIHEDAIMKKVAITSRCLLFRIMSCWKQNTFFHNIYLLLVLSYKSGNREEKLSVYPC